jgi:hypothetical protein
MALILPNPLPTNFGGTGLQSPGSNGNVLTSNGTIWTTATPSGGSTSYNITSQSTTYNATINDYVIASGASFTITLPTAVSQSGKQIIIQHNGTSLTDAYTLNTTSSQTINGPGGTVSSGNYVLYTNGEKVILTSDGSNWQVTEHDTNTGWVSDTTAIASNFDFTITAPGGSGITIGAVYDSTYAFTVTALTVQTNVGATYTNNGNTYTVRQQANIGATLLITTGSADPSASGTLTQSGGTGQASITFSSFVGEPIGRTFTAAATVSAGGTTLYATGAFNPAPTSGTGYLFLSSGTGPTIVTFSAWTGNTANPTGTTTNPSTAGIPVTNAVYWRRVGSTAMINFNYEQTAAGLAGSGDYIWRIPSGMTLDTSTLLTTYTASVGAYLPNTAASLVSFVPTTGSMMNTASTTSSVTLIAALYSSTQFRIASLVDSSGGLSANNASSAFFAFSNTTLAYNFTITVPILGWQP